MTINPPPPPPQLLLLWMLVPTTAPLAHRSCNRRLAPAESEPVGDGVYERMWVSMYNAFRRRAVAVVVTVVAAGWGQGGSHDLALDVSQVSPS